MAGWHDEISLKLCENVASQSICETIQTMTPNSLRFKKRISWNTKLQRFFYPYLLQIKTHKMSKYERFFIWTRQNGVIFGIIAFGKARNCERTDRNRIRKRWNFETLSECLVNRFLPRWDRVWTSSTRAVSSRCHHMAWKNRQNRSITESIPAHCGVKGKETADRLQESPVAEGGDLADARPITRKAARACGCDHVQKTTDFISRAAL